MPRIAIELTVIGAAILLAVSTIFGGTATIVVAVFIAVPVIYGYWRALDESRRK